MLLTVWLCGHRYSRYDFTLCLVFAVLEWLYFSTYIEYAACISPFAFGVSAMPDTLCVVKYSELWLLAAKF